MNDDMNAIIEEFKKDYVRELVCIAYDNRLRKILRQISNHINERREGIKEYMVGGLIIEHGQITQNEFHIRDLLNEALRINEIYSFRHKNNMMHEDKNGIKEL